MDFSFIRLIVSIEIEEDGVEASDLFASRRDFMTAFRRSVSCSRDSCPGCEVDSCPFHQVFGQGLSPDPSAVKRFQKPPLPFVFDFPLGPPLPGRGTILEIGLNIFGSAVNHLGTFLAAFSLMLQQDEPPRGFTARVLRVEFADYDGSRRLMSMPGEFKAGDGLLLLSLDGLCSSSVLPMDRVTVTLDAPLRIYRDARLLRKLGFSEFARSLMRRVSSISYYFGGVEPDVDFKWLATKSGRVETVAESVQWRELGRGVSGLIGSATFAGDIGEFHPFLLAGEYLHVGKGASFGFGRFHLQGR
jgi:hypothetical protein